MNVTRLSYTLLLGLLGSVWSAPLAYPLPAGERTLYAVGDFGAQGDGIDMDTASVQRTIDACAERGGGTVYFAPGTYLCGSIHLASNITLYLDNGAIILASADDKEFDPFEELGFKNDSDEETSFFHFSLIWAEAAENIAILGAGTIDSNRTGRTGPKTIGLKRCKQVTIRDITIRNAGNYAVSMLGTDFVNIDGISIFSSYCDGIDPDCCQNVRISNCYIESWDDAIVPKASFSLGYRRSTENIVVNNCVIATSCNAFKLGTESGGDFKHITVSNCVMTTYKSEVDYREPTPPISGIALISVDGSNIHDLTLTNIVMDEVRFPIFIRLGNRGRDMDEPVPGTLKRVVISNITASNALIGGILIGLPERPIEDILFDNIRIACKGGGTKEQPNIDVPAKMLEYPSASRFRDVPTYGFYSRHVKGLKFEDVHVSFESPDTRSAVICEDVADLTFDSFRTQTANNAAPQISLNNVRDATIQGCRPSAGTSVFLKVIGERSQGIGLSSNDFNRVDEVFMLGESVDPNSVKSQFNH